MGNDPYDRTGSKGPKVILIILVLCVLSFVLWYATQTDDPDRNRIAELFDDVFGDGSQNLVINEIPTPLPLYENNVVFSDETQYYYQQLSDYEKETYDSLYMACKEYKDEVSIKPVKTEEFERALYAFRDDHPEFFWMQGSVVQTTLINGSVYKAAYNVPLNAESKMKELEKKAEEILRYAPKSDYEKVKYFYEYIINNTDYDLNAPDNQTAYSALINGRSVCAGYSGAFLYLCDKAGIYCGYASGEVVGRGLHGWNFVRLNGKYYWVDVTWGDPAFEDGFVRENNLNYDYLCVTDKEILADRILSNDPRYSEYNRAAVFAYPQCTDNSLNYYVQAGCYFESYDKDMIYEYILTQIGDEGNKRVEMKFASEEAYLMALNDTIRSDDFLDSLVVDLRFRYGIKISQSHATMSDTSYRLLIEFS